MIYEQILKSIELPFAELNLVELGVIKDVQQQGDNIAIQLEFGFPCQDVIEPLSQQLKSALANNGQVQINAQTNIISHAVQPNLKGLAEVKNVIVVASAKGGVGKSTVAVNLAAALQQQGAKVGLLDADIYGPSQPHMLGNTAKPKITADKKFMPLVCHGLQTMSIGYLIDAKQPMVWRGPMVSKALEQLAFDTLWQDLDYLIVDLPPGTGDIQLTLAQKIPVAGAIIVTTPQDIALIDARKGLEMFNKVKVPVLGIVENMSYHQCSQCGHQDAIFGSEGAASMAKDCETTLLGQLPLDKQIRQQADSGTPLVVSHPQSDIAKRYHDIALQAVARLSLRPKNYARQFPDIVVT